MDWGASSDYWWLKPVGQAQVSPAMQFGAQLRHQAIGNALKQKDQELENQRTGIQIQEYFSKKELQNEQLQGTAAMAQTMAQFLDPTDPRIPETIYGQLAKSPMLAPIAEQYLDNHRQALQFKQRQEELAELRLSREQTAAAALTERIARREGAEAYNTERLAIWQQRAYTGQMDAESRAEYRDFQKENVNLTHEETARRLAVMESNAATRQQRLNDKIQNLPPEKRDLLKRDMDRLDVRAEAGEFTKRMPWGTKNIKYGPKYDEERKKLLDSYGVSSGAMPLNTTLKQPLSLEKAKEFLNQAGGDKEKARKVAQDAGYEF